MSQDPNAPQSDNPYPPPPPPLFDDQPAATASAPPPPPHFTPPPNVPGVPSKDERNWAMFAHLSAIVAGIIATIAHLPFLTFLGPLVIYLLKKDESAFIADQAKEALNFTISCSIVLFGLFILTLTIILGILTVPMMMIVFITGLILTIIAAVKSNEGVWYRYPFSLRLIK